MKRNDMEIVERGFEIFLFLFLAVLFLYIIKSFIMPLLLASALVFLGWKPYKWIDSKIRNDGFSALIMLILVLILIFVPLFWLTTSVIIELTNILQTSEGVVSGSVDLSFCPLDFCRELEKDFSHFTLNVENVLGVSLKYISTSFEGLFYSATEFILNFFIFIFAFFFLLKDGDAFKRYLKRVIPIRNDYKNALFLKFRDVSEAVFLNALLIALLQGSLTAIGFFVVGIDSYIFWGVVAGFTSLLPLFGTSLVWLPAGIYLFLTGDSFFGMILLIYGGTVITLSDNIVRPYLLKKTVHVHEFLIFISILGGIKVFGFLAGLFLGPMIISLLIAVLDIYKIDFK